MGSETPYFGVISGCWTFFFFFGCWWHFCFSYGHAWQTSCRLEAMWSKPHTAGCSRASVKAARSPCTEEFYSSLLCSDLFVLTIQWPWMIFLAEPIKNTTQVNQALGYLSDRILWPWSFCIVLFVSHPCASLKQIPGLLSNPQVHRALTCLSPNHLQSITWPLIWDQILLCLLVTVSSGWTGMAQSFLNN